MKNKDIIIFDYDNTLADSRQPLDIEMRKLFCSLLEKKQVVIITGGTLEHAKKQITDIIPCLENIKNLHLLLTTGSIYYRWNNNEWEEVYSYVLSNEDAEYIISTFKKVIDSMDINFSPNIKGEQFENRRTQITFSALGQDANLEDKKVWDPNQEKRKEIVEKLKQKLSNFDIHIGGTTSIDITKKGIDKKWGLETFFEYMKWNQKDALFIGDALFVGGNDYPVTKTDIDIKETTSPEETKKIINTILMNN